MNNPKITEHNRSSFDYDVLGDKPDKLVAVLAAEPQHFRHFFHSVLEGELWHKHSELTGSRFLYVFANEQELQGIRGKDFTHYYVFSYINGGNGQAGAYDAYKRTVNALQARGAKEVNLDII